MSPLEPMDPQSPGKPAKPLHPLDPLQPLEPLQPLGGCSHGTANTGAEKPCDSSPSHQFGGSSYGSRTSSHAAMSEGSHEHYASSSESSEAARGFNSKSRAMSSGDRDFKGSAESYSSYSSAGFGYSIPADNPPSDCKHCHPSTPGTNGDNNTDIPDKPCPPGTKGDNTTDIPGKNSPPETPTKPNDPVHDTPGTPTNPNNTTHNSPCPDKETCHSTYHNSTSTGHNPPCKDCSKPVQNTTGNLPIPSNESNTTSNTPDNQEPHTDQTTTSGAVSKIPISTYGTLLMMIFGILLVL
ncbi:hypothetical protein O181_053133 [Austropuccinia psidii MF-1]|uniref:Uncharacterized protein n=1 Tax=Austropuccinia psidii MF-1 TaxID=1389203 RepID=A0A9Q3E6U4_9BASI|nr:hypothetical protein [Austropuccinia psidii MF-1]